MALSQFFMQELKSRCNLTDIASSYVRLKRNGKNMVGLCPFHNEKTPSFFIYPDNGSFYCFGCNKGGDVVTFIMNIENLDYIEAVKFLAQRSGIQMPEDGYDDSIAKLKTRILEINRETARFYYSLLSKPEGQAGLDYFRQRGLDSDTIRHFGLGYAPDGAFSLVNHLKSKGYTANEMVQANVASMSKKGYPYDRFRARAMFPIIDLRGNVVAFGGRILTDEKPKYINTSDTPVYHKSSGLYAMNFAKNAGKDQLILAEGYMDVIALHKAGFTNAIASLGTSLTEEQARIMSRYAKEIVICYDSDEAGQRATKRAIPILRNSGLNVRILVIPGNKDPDEFMKSYGKDGEIRFKALLDGAEDDLDYELFKAKSKYNIETSAGKINYVTEAARLLAELDNPITQDVYVSKIASETGVNRSSIDDILKKNIEQKKHKAKKEVMKEYNKIPAQESVVNPEKLYNAKAANAEEKIIAYIFKNPDKIEYLSAKIPPEKFITSFNRRLYQLIMGKNIYNEISISDFTQDLNSDEISELTRIIAVNDGIPITSTDVNEYIEVILNDIGIMTPDRIKDESIDDLQRKIKKLGEKKS